MANDLVLEISNLNAGIDGIPILKGIDLNIKAGQVHAIMGPNGSGKSTLANVIAGNPQYKVSSGKISFQGENLLALSPDARARAGIFLSFQNPVSIPGVRLDHFLRAAVNSINNSRDIPEIDPLQFEGILATNGKLVDFNPQQIRRSVNDGFSGGERKRSEILQMAILKPKVAILDEPDSGLDVDALQTVARAINTQKEEGRAFIVVTHYQRILQHVVPDVVNILIDGRIVKTGDNTLALEIESKGYDWLSRAK